MCIFSLVCCKRTDTSHFLFIAIYLCTPIDDSYSTAGPVSAWMGDCFGTGKPP